MPVGAMKNGLYGLLLPIIGQRCQWTAAGGADQQALEKLLYKRRTVGACVQCFEKGELTKRYAVGFATLGENSQPVTEATIFRTASIAKMVSALLVFRLQTLGKLNVCEEVSDFLGYPVHNPSYPDAPLTLGMLLNHTSSIVDCPAYFASFAQPGKLKELLLSPAAYSGSLPGLQFQYSNLGAGMIGCLLEKRFNQSYEALIQNELFEPLGIDATFDLRKLAGKPLADAYRVLPAACCFDGHKRLNSAPSLDAPDPESHYLLASGNLYITSEMLARLTIAIWNGHDGFIAPDDLALMHTPTVDWPRKEVHMRYGMGLLKIEDTSVCPKPLWGHQGFAYGAVNGAFFDESCNGFVCLNSGTSEQRRGHLSVLNLDLIKQILQG